MTPPWIALAVVASLASAQDYRDYLCKEINKPFFQAEGAKGGPRQVRLARRLAQPITFAMPKPAKTRRMFIVGESVAGKLWEPEHDALTEAAEAAWPGLRVEHINAGMTAYNSRRIAAVLEEGLDYDPDVVVVFSGNNEHDAMELCPSVWEGLERQFKRTSLYRKLASEKRSPEAYARELSMRRHEWQLRRMAAAAAKRRVPVFFATLPANERDYPPTGEAPWDSADFAAGMAALERRDAKAAASAFEGRLKTAPEDSFAHWFLARALEALGEPARALAHYEQAVRLDPKGDRSSAERNAMIRRVAAAEGAGVVDLERAFRDAAGGPVGGDWLADGVHWHRRLNPFVAREMLAAVRKSSFTSQLAPWSEAAPAAERPPKPSPEVRREELRNTLLYGIRNASYWAATDRKGAISEIAVAMFDEVDRDERAWLLESSATPAAMLPKLIENYWSQDLAADLQEWWPVYLSHVGEMYRRKGEAKLALDFFDQALGMSPQRYRVRLWRALALKALGRAAEASRELDALRPLKDRTVGAVSAAYSQISTQ